MTQAGSEAYNAVQHHGDGTVSVRGGFVPISIAGVAVPDRADPDRLYNRDVYSMTVDECMAEDARLAEAVEERARLRAQGVRDVIVLKEHGATSFEEWAESRRHEIAKRVLYGR